MVKVTATVKVRVWKGGGMNIPIARSIGFISDMHVGSTVAIWPADYGTPEGVVVKAGEGQLKLLEYWEEVARQFKKMNVDTVVLNGDCLEGLNRKEGGRGLMTSNLDHQLEACYELLRDMIPKKNTKIWVFSGSTYHESIDTQIHQKLVDMLLPHYPFAKFFGYMANIELNGTKHQQHGDEITLNIQHGFGGGSIYRTTKMDREALFVGYAEYAKKIEKRIDVIVRGHLHYYAHLDMDKLVLQLPCWKAFEMSRIFLRNYGRMQADIGAVVLQVSKNGELFVRRLTDFELPNISDSFVRG